MTGLLLLLAACGPLLPQGQEAPRLFVLEAPKIAPEKAAPAPVSLQLVLPQASPGLDTERIALHRSGQELDYYKDAQWSGALPVLVQSQLIEAFEQAKVVQSVGSDLIQFRPDWVLAAEIRDFQAEYEDPSAPTAHVRLVARLVHGQELASSVTCEEREKAGANRMQEIVAAQNAAFAKTASCLVKHVSAALSKGVIKSK